MKPLIVEQKVTPLANQYRIYETDEQGNKASLIAFAHQKRIAFREKVEFFSDEQRQQQVFTVGAEKVVDVHGKFVVSDTSGQALGKMRKAFRSSLLRSTWEILDENDQTLLTVTESSMALAIFRRVWGFIPFLGDLPFLFKYHFDFIAADGTLVAKYKKTKLLYDHYQLQPVSNTAEIDWRVVAAQCVLLDALQGR